MYTAHQYLFEAQTHFDAIEQSTKRTIDERDEGISLSQWADFITAGRRKVMLTALRWAKSLVASVEQTVAVTGESIRIYPPNSALLYEPLSIVLIEDVETGYAFPLSAVPNTERHRYSQVTTSSPISALRVVNMVGATLRFLPAYADPNDIRITYVPQPERWEEERLADRATPDTLLPPSIQDAVPVWAAKLACVKERAPHPGLDELWAEMVADIKTKGALQHSHAPRMIRYTGAAT